MIIVLLGGAGLFARRVIRDYTSRLPEEHEFIIADYDYRTARKMAKALGERFTPRMVDVALPESFEKAAGESSLVVSFVGPLYRFGDHILDGILRTGKPLIFTNIADFEISEEKREKLPGAGITCVRGVSLLPGAIDLMADDLMKRYPGAREVTVTLSIDTGAYGGLAFIREYFSLLSRGIGVQRKGEMKGKVKILLSPKGIFQKGVFPGKTDEPGIRTELLATLQDMVRKKPRPGTRGGIDLNISLLDSERTHLLEPDGEKLFPLLTGMLAGATRELIEGAGAGVLTLSDISAKPGFRKFVEKDLKELLDPK